MNVQRHQAFIASGVPTSYRAMFAFLFSGSGIWALLLGMLLPGLIKLLYGHWDLLDSGIVLAFFFGRGAIEWMIHSWLYHANPLPVIGWRLRSSVSDAHIRHHMDPSDLSTLLITWRGVVAVLLVTFAGFYLVFGNMDRALTMVIGFAIVGTMIELLHLVCHCRIPHRNALMKSLVRLHRYHHHVDSHNFYGVSSSMGDRLFGTFPVAAVPADEERT